MSAAGAAPRRVVVRLPNWVGDIVMATAALRSLRLAWPEARLVAAGPPAAAAVLEGLDSLDEVLVLPARRGGLWPTVRLLRDGRYDLALLLPNSFSSAWSAALAGIPRRVGYRGGGRGMLLTEALDHPAERGRHRLPVPMVEYYFRLLDLLGVPRGSHRTELATTDRDEQAADAWLQRHGLEPGVELYGFQPGASYGPSKLWYPASFAAVADALHQRRGGRTIVFCGPGETGMARDIAAACSSPVVSSAEDVIDLRTLKAVIRRLALLVTTDTGPRHFGPPFDVPTVALMGSTDARFTNTNLHATEMLSAGVACSPCQLKVCPIDHRCMTRLTPQMVLAAAGRLLARRA